ncbi:MAG: hypothetical protein NC123_00190 [Butyrivibrio sp.]|nr:hypothetical protein [Acetatifactor muris]MCM1557953.1 hypothetical protein [Butyrivibrio sp.]
MNENSYEEYKRNFSREEKKSGDFKRGRLQFLLGLVFGIYVLWILPFHAGDVSEMHGEEVKGGKAYYPIQVYYIKDLQILEAKTDTEDGEIYCVAKFYDCDQKEWIISFTPGNSESVKEYIELSKHFPDGPDLKVSGYFQMQYLEDLSFEADSFYSVYGRKYADAEGGNMPELNAKYLCDISGNYILEVLLHPGIPLVSLVAAVGSILFGGIAVLKNRPSKKTQNKEA